MLDFLLGNELIRADAKIPELRMFSRGTRCRRLFTSMCGLLAESGVYSVLQRLRVHGHILTNCKDKHQADLKNSFSGSLSNGG